MVGTNTGGTGKRPGEILDSGEKGKGEIRQERKEVERGDKKKKS